MSISDRLRAWFDAIDGDFIVPVEAAKFVAQAREQFPVELAEWLDEHAVASVSARMAQISNSHRATAQRRHSAREFDAATDDPERLKAFLLLDSNYVFDASDTRRPLRDFTREDLEFAIADYDAQSKAAAFEATFLRAIAKRVTKGKTVGDVWTEEQLRALRQAAA